MKGKWQDFNTFWDNLQEKLGHGRPGGTPEPPAPNERGGIGIAAKRHHLTAGGETGTDREAGARYAASSALKDISGNAKLVADALGTLGLNATQVAGFLANFARESRFDPTKVGANGDTGLAQWVGARLEALKAAEGPQWNTIQGQIDFLLKELQGHFAGLLAKVKNAKTAEESSQLVGTEYEVHHGGSGPAFREEQEKRDTLAGNIARGEGLSSTSVSGGAGGAPLADYRRDYEAFAETEKRKLAEAKGDYAAQKAIIDEWLAHVVDIYKKDGLAIAENRKEYQEVAALRDLVKKPMPRCREYKTDPSQ